MDSTGSIDKIERCKMQDVDVYKRKSLRNEQLKWNMHTASYSNKFCNRYKIKCANDIACLATANNVLSVNLMLFRAVVLRKSPCRATHFGCPTWFISSAQWQKLQDLNRMNRRHPSCAVPDHDWRPLVETELFRFIVNKWAVLMADMMECKFW